MANSAQTMAVLRPSPVNIREIISPKITTCQPITWKAPFPGSAGRRPGPLRTQPVRASAPSGEAAYQAAIDNGYFSLIVLSFTDTPKTDAQIVADMRQAGTYHLVDAVPFHDAFGTGHELVWAYEPHPASHQGTHGHG